jgi:pseudouridine-5'-monophosphatase
VLGDDPRIAKGRGKPAPDIYLLALETINEELRKKGKKEISPAECLVFEDAVPGVEAGRRAGMRVIWCPHQGLLQEFKGREEDVLAGLTGAAVDEPVGEDKALANDKIAAGWPGQRGDGWGQWVMSLENFDWAKYGVKVPES